MINNESLGSNFIFYRLPRASKAHLIRCNGDDIIISYDIKEIGNKEGYVFAPFKISEEKPLLIFPFKDEETLDLDEESLSDITEILDKTSSSAEKETYICLFNKFHKCISDGKCAKIVLSRKTHITKQHDISPCDLFLTACRICPDMYVSLVSSPLCGMWLTATPEYLADSKNGCLHTASLAGTRQNTVTDEMNIDDCTRDNDSWSGKNIVEQDYVSQYVRERVEQYAKDIIEKGPQTIKAGNVCHLLTDFSYKLKEDVTLGMLLDKLHPTPAVCGIPKDFTYNYILENEHYDREYYSGFQGKISSKEGIHLFVTLRCMKVLDNGYDLFAGGGLVFESDKEYEWLETEAKMQTMKRCIATKKA